MTDKKPEEPQQSIFAGKTGEKLLDLGFNTTDKNMPELTVLSSREVFLNAVGVKLSDKINPISKLLELNIVPTLKSNNNKVHYIQEGPSWLFNDYEISDQINFYNTLSECDSIFAHNECDTKF